MPRIVHFEIHAENVDRARQFYSAVFGWKFTSWGGPEEYWLVSTGDPGEPGIDGGLMKRRDPAGSVYNTIDVSDLDRSIEQVTAAGGQIVVPRMPIPGVGWLAYFKDTEGNIFGMAQRDTDAK